LLKEPSHLLRSTSLNFCHTPLFKKWLILRIAFYNLLAETNIPLLEKLNQSIKQENRRTIRIELEGEKWLPRNETLLAEITFA